MIEDLSKVGMKYIIAENKKHYFNTYLKGAFKQYILASELSSS